MNEPPRTQPGDLHAARIPYVVPDSLDQLTGPRSGVVELPIPIDWSPKTGYDLGDPDDRVLLYTTVISEAATVDDLARFLNKDLLIALWPQLRLPRYCVRRWHTAFPQLAAIGAGGVWQ
ncbi:hypothetical protein [Kribbella sp. DT2]|uniref:hypothetical protein n=1 Tax=Kribbella sp. DT2 TaxID=3393427 RepID=UPI003CEC5409